MPPHLASCPTLPFPRNGGVVAGQLPGFDAVNLHLTPWADGVVGCCSGVLHQRALTLPLAPLFTARDLPHPTPPRTSTCGPITGAPLPHTLPAPLPAVAVDYPALPPPASPHLPAVAWCLPHHRAFPTPPCRPLLPHPSNCTPLPAPLPHFVAVLVGCSPVHYHGVVVC